VHYGWIVVGAAFTVLFLTYGVQYAFGLFFIALTEEFGWSRASLSGVFSLYAAAYAFFGLFAGRLTDRWGPRAVVALGGGFLGLGLSGGVQNLVPLSRPARGWGRRGRPTGASRRPTTRDTVLTCGRSPWSS
jgi:MFS family permease